MHIQKWIFLSVITLLSFVHLPAQADSKITVDQLKLYRPAYVRNHPSQPGRKIRDSGFQEPNKIFSPASQQLVEFYDKDTISNEFCGSYWTDLKGEVKGAALYCNDDKKSWEIWKSDKYDPADIMVKIYAQSAKGFKIFDQMEISTQLVRWALDTGFPIKNRYGVPATSSQEEKYVSLGSWALGFSSNDQTHRWAAALQETVDWSYSTLSAYAQGWIPATNWVINYPFGAAFTYWTTIHMKGNESQIPYLLYSASHELGHAIYNRLHSGNFHYINEVLYYAHVHQNCQPVTKTTGSIASRPEMFAQYEGHANTTRSLLWALETGLPGDHPIGCAPAYNDDARLGVDIEGNVNAFYFWSLMGSDQNFNRPLGKINQYDLFTPGNEYAPTALRPLSDHYQMLLSAGSNSHTLEDMWDRYLNTQCSSTYRDPFTRKSVRKYCGTNHFKQLAIDDLFNDDEIFFEMNALPDARPSSMQYAQPARAGAADLPMIKL